MQTFSPILNSNQQQLPFIDYLQCSMLDALWTRFHGFFTTTPGGRCYNSQVAKDLRCREVKELTQGQDLVNAGTAV